MVPLLSSVSSPVYSATASDRLFVMDHENKKEFRGVWIRASLWRRKDLTWFEKCLIAEIDCFADNCFASNAYLAEMMNTTESRLSNALTKLRKMGLVIDAGFNGRVRQILVADNVSSDPKIHNPTEKKVESGFTQRLRQGSPICEGSIHTGVNIYTNREHSLELTPIVPLKGESETSAKASGSSRNCSETSPQNKSREKTKRQPKLADQPFLDNLRENNPRVDFDTELRKMDNWLLAHQGRQRTRAFVTNWINRVVDKLPPEDEWRPTTI